MSSAEQRLTELYASSEACFHQAVKNCGEEIVVDHRIGGRAIRMRFAGRDLLPAVARAFAHLSVPANVIEPELTVLLWDSQASGVAMPRPPWHLTDYTVRGEILGHTTSRFRTSYHTLSGVWNMADMETGRAIYWIKDAQDVPGYATGTPLLPILHWWMATRSMQLVHAGVVGAETGAALLAGKGGAGKSTTALSCLAAGLRYVSDDFCLLQPDPLPRAHSVFCTGKLHPADLDHLSFLQPFVSEPRRHSSEKALIFLQECFPQRLAPELPLRVILLPRVAEQRRTTWEPAPPAVAHRALTAVTLHYLPGAGQAALDTIARTVKALPTYFLNLGSERAGVASAICAILEEAT